MNVAFGSIGIHDVERTIGSHEVFGDIASRVDIHQSQADFILAPLAYAVNQQLAVFRHVVKRDGFRPVLGKLDGIDEHDIVAVQTQLTGCLADAIRTAGMVRPGHAY